MRIFQHLPGPRLRPYIARIWGWQAEADEMIHLPELLPGTGAELYFHFGSQPYGSDGMALAPASELICLRQRRVDLGKVRNLDFLAVRFRIGMLPRFVGMPVGELLDARLPLEALWGMAGLVLQQRLHALETIGQRVALIEAFLARQLAAHSGDLLIEQAQALLYRHAGVLSIDGLAKLSGLGCRQLERRCLQAAGISPGEMRGLCRFQQAVRALLLNPGESLSALSLRLGYYDQAHFCRDFARRAGCTPRRFLHAARERTHFYNTPGNQGRMLTTP